MNTTQIVFETPLDGACCVKRRFVSGHVRAHRRAAACARRVWSDQWCMLLLLLDMPAAAALVCIAALSSSELATVELLHP